MVGRKILVRWDLSDPSKPKGTAIPCEGTARTSKIVFPERGFDTHRLRAGVWECAVVHDTQPGQPRRGALVVRPLRAVTYDWIAVGPELWGVREVKYICVEYPALGDADAPGSVYERFLEGERRNVAWRAACEKQALWTGSLWGHADKFLVAFGEPSSIRPAVETSRTGESQAVLVYQHGEKTVETRSLASAWAVSATGSIRQVDHEVQAEFAIDRAPDCRFWDGVGRLGGADAYSPPYTMTRYEQLDATTQERVLELLRASAISPEDMAVAYWRTYVVDSYRGPALDAAWADLAALHAPEAAISTGRYRGQIHYAESDDGYRPAGAYAADFLRQTLHVGERSFVVADHPERDNVPLRDAETERRRLIAERWQQIGEALACRVPELTAHSAEILGMSESDWTARYHAAWAQLADAHRRAQAARATEFVYERLRDLAEVEPPPGWEQRAEDAARRARLRPPFCSIGASRASTTAARSGRRNLS